MHSTHFFARAWIAGILAASAIACAAHGNDPPPAPSWPTADSFCRARGEAECSSLVVTKCGAKDRDACVTSRATQCTASAPQGTTYVPEHAKACLDLVTRVFGAGVVTSEDSRAMSTTCGTEIWSGPGAARAPCTTPYDCSSLAGLTCVMALGETSGKCLAPHRVGAGAACPGEADECSDGYFCDSKSKTCIVEAVEGEPCHPTIHPCAPGLYCIANPFSSGCQKLFAKGHGCQQDAECADGLCDKLSGSPQGTCTDAIIVASPDGYCATFK